jgi:hypothetical protein
VAKVWGRHPACRFEGHPCPVLLRNVGNPKPEANPFEQKSVLHPISNPAQRPEFVSAGYCEIRPDNERWSHYFDAHLSEQFDAVIHFDETRAVEPLERTAEWDRGEVETYPSGF